MCHAGKGGRAARKLTVEQTRQKTTLFGAYLDAGAAGRELGLQVLCEAAGLLLAPLTVSYTELVLRWTAGSKELWQRAEACVLAQQDEDQPPCSAAALALSHALLALSDETSPLATALSYVDYNNYNWFMTHVVTRVTPLINANMWFFRIMQQAPYYYYRFYLGDGASRLPVYRNACILREGLRVAALEAGELRSKIAAKKRAVEEEGGTVDARLDAHGRVTDAGGGLLSSFQSTAEPSGPDFGPDGNWQALNGTCLSRLQGEYVYQVCAFQQILQDRVVLGTFSHWGDQPREVQPPPRSESRVQAFKNKVRGRSGKQSSVAAATSYLAGLVSGEGGKEAAPGGAVAYSKQFYGGGAACHNGIVRHAVVTLQCAAFAQIVDVVEYEVRESAPSCLRIHLHLHLPTLSL